MEPIRSEKASLPFLGVIMAAAAVESAALYALHLSDRAHHWPATDPAWSQGLYALAVFAPLTAQLLADRAQRTLTWLGVIGIGVAFFCFGREWGSSIDAAGPSPFGQSDNPLPFMFLLAIIWLIALPFLQSKLAAQTWAGDYQLLFIFGWRNQLTLAEAGLFTGLFWLLLQLWQTLFHLLGIDFFQTLFQNPLFIYPITSLAFGSALYLVGSVDRLVSSVLEQILNVLKWLAPLTAVILALFTATLLFKLPGLVFSGEKAIGATWLLWLVAVVVLFVNAAFRDGHVERPYPRSIAFALRLVVPLTVVISITALYALFVRTNQYGLTVERVWAFIVAGSAVLYSIGYSIAALRPGASFAGVARVNVVVALMLLVILSAALTPLLSPLRLAADSQYRLIVAPGVIQNSHLGAQLSPYQYLRFNAGKYGRAKLEALKTLNDNTPRGEEIRTLAATAETAKNPWDKPPPARDTDLAARIVVFPRGRSLDGRLLQALRTEWQSRDNVFQRLPNPSLPIAGIFIDLDGAGVEDQTTASGRSRPDGKS